MSRDQLATGTPTNEDEACLRRLAHQIKSKKVAVKLFLSYETLEEHGIAEKLREVYPQVTWDKPFAEFDAARARDATKTKSER